MPCGAQTQDSPGSYTVWAKAVVAKPWLGPHHVYGIFMVPGRFLHRRDRATLSVGEYRVAVDFRQSRASLNSEATIQPGHYGKRVHIPTRVGLKFLVTGRLGDLRTPCTWSIRIEEPMIPAKHEARSWSGFP